MPVLPRRGKLEWIAQNFVKFRVRRLRKVIAFERERAQDPVEIEKSFVFAVLELPFATRVNSCKLWWGTIIVSVCCPLYEAGDSHASLTAR